MIKYNLICGHQHEFEAWFQNNSVFEQQQKNAEIECPLCTNTVINKAIMMPHIRKKTTTHLQTNTQTDKIIKMIKDIQEHVTDNFDYVGDKFSHEARAIYYGDRKKRDIYGETTPEDAMELIEEGIPVVPIPGISPKDKN